MTIATIKIKWKHFWQRQNRGFDDTELWGLDDIITQFILPRLKAFREFNNTTPSEITVEEWNTILDKMIKAFEVRYHQWDESCEYPIDYQEGLELFAKYYDHLWD